MHKEPFIESHGLLLAYNCFVCLNTSFLYALYINWKYSFHVIKKKMWKKEEESMQRKGNSEERIPDWVEELGTKEPRLNKKRVKGDYFMLLLFV